MTKQSCHLEIFSEAKSSSLTIIFSENEQKRFLKKKKSENKSSEAKVLGITA